jgi:hypothetical protein
MLVRAPAGVKEIVVGLGVAVEAGDRGEEELVDARMTLPRIGSSSGSRDGAAQPGDALVGVVSRGIADDTRPLVQSEARLLERAQASTCRIVSACCCGDQSVYVSPVVAMLAWPARSCAAFKFPVLSSTRWIAVWRAPCIRRPAVVPSATIPAFARQRYHQRWQPCSPIACVEINPCLRRSRLDGDRQPRVGDVERVEHRRELLRALLISCSVGQERRT